MDKIYLSIQEYTVSNSNIAKAYFSFLLSSQKIMGRTESFMSNFNVSNTQLSILLLLHSSKAFSETTSSISKKLGLSIPTISNVLSTLHKKKFIQKKSLPKDKRSTYIGLDRNGVDFLKKFIPLYKQKYEELFSNFNINELDDLKNLSLKIFFNLNDF